MDERFEWRTDCFGRPNRALYFMGLFVGCILETKKDGPYRAWIMTDDSGERVGKDRWKTEETARNAAQKAASAIVSAHHNKIVR